MQETNDNQTQNKTSRQWIRQYTLLIGENKQTGLYLTSEDVSNDSGISGLRISFEISKDTTNKTNKSKIKIWNLSDKSLDLVEHKDIMIDLAAGYKDDIGAVRIFFGTSVSVSTHEDNNGLDVVTEIEAMDGGIQLRDSIISVGAAKGTSTISLIKTCAKKMGLTYNIAGDVQDKPYPTGFSFCNYARYLMDTLCEKLGCSWSVQNGIVQVICKKGTSGWQGSTFNASTGLIGYPERINLSSTTADGKSDSSKSENENKVHDFVETFAKRAKRIADAKASSTNDKKGWKIKTLLAPTVSPGDEIEIQSKMVEGRFKVDKITHTGDIMGSDWFSDIEVSEVIK